jgi:hypothetical protein
VSLYREILKGETMHNAQAIVAAMAVMAAVTAGSSLAAEKVKPYPHYWMSVSTVNQSIPGMSAEMSGLAGLFGGKSGFGPRRDLQLQLESPRQAAEPAANHAIPPGQNMGTSLPLVTPKTEKSEYVPAERGEPEKYEKPKARMLIYWGCGETIGKGQPKVIDTATMAPADFGKAFAGRTPTRQTPPSPHKGWTYGEWPNRDDHTEIPKESSLVGSHKISGNYVTDIPFALDKQRDFMAPVEFSPIQAAAAGALKVEWQAIPTAIGYFASAMGHNQETGESIFWTSSEVPETGFGLQDYLTPGDVSRFIKEKVVMEPTRTTCTVPPVFPGGQGAMLQFIAYGEELNLAHPPKPKDPKKFWQPEWSVKVRLKSTGMTTLMAGDDSSAGRRKAAPKSRQKSAPAAGEDGASRPADEDAAKPKEGVVDRIRGVFGF